MTSTQSDALDAGWGKLNRSLVGSNAQEEMVRRLLAFFAALLTAGAAVIAVPPTANANPNPYGCKQPTYRTRYLPAWDRNYETPSTLAAASWSGTNTNVVVEEGTAQTASGTIDNENLGTFSGFWGITRLEGVFSFQCGGDGIINYWSAIYNNYYTDGFSAVKRRAVMAHELGHVLGLAHAGSWPTCDNVPLMYDGGQVLFDVCGVYGPRTNDIESVNNLY